VLLLGIAPLIYAPSRLLALQTLQLCVPTITLQALQLCVPTITLLALQLCVPTIPLLLIVLRDNPEDAMHAAQGGGALR
jgi:hypothetical protein